MPQSRVPCFQSWNQMKAFKINQYQHSTINDICIVLMCRYTLPVVCLRLHCHENEAPLVNRNSLRKPNWVVHSLHFCLHSPLLFRRFHPTWHSSSSCPTLSCLSNWNCQSQRRHLSEAASDQFNRQSGDVVVARSDAIVVSIENDHVIKIIQHGSL